MSLLDARRIIADGWSEPFTLSAAGRHCLARDEDAATFCVRDALILAGVYPEGWERLENVARPAQAWWRDLTPDLAIAGGLTSADVALSARAAAAEGEDFQAWLEAPGRQLDEVLTVLDRAILNASQENGT